MVAGDFCVCTVLVMEQLVKGASDNAKLINEYLYQLRNKIFQKEIELMENGFMLTPILLKEAVNDHVEAVNQKTLMQVFDDFQAMRKPLIGKKIAKDTYEDNELTGRCIIVVSNLLCFYNFSILLLINSM